MFKRKLSVHLANWRGGHECPLPSEVLTQALLQHVDPCIGMQMLSPKYASAVSMHIDRVTLQLIYCLD